MDSRNPLSISVSETKQEMGALAARRGAEALRRALDEKSYANIIVATGASQFEMFQSLTAAENINWTRVTAFHLDEYIGMNDTHPASFRRYLRERFADLLPAPLRQFHYIDAERDAPAACERLGALIRSVEIDVAFVGVGENCHLAFNDPPADFQTEEPYLIVDLDEACRRQQHGEGWFETLDDVPRQAVSMSIRQIMKSRAIVCTVPDARKAEAMRLALEGPIGPNAPASILREHPDCSFFFDAPAAALLRQRRTD